MKTIVVLVCVLLCGCGGVPDMPTDTAYAKIEVNAKSTKAGNWTTATNRMSRDLPFAFTHGTGENQIDLIYHGTVTITDNSATQIDLQSFTDHFGTTDSSYDYLRLIWFRCTDNNHDHRLAIWAPTAPPSTYYLPWNYGPDATGYDLIGDDDVYVRVSPTVGYSVTSGSRYINFSVSEGQAGAATSYIEFYFAGISS